MIPTVISFGENRPSVTGSMSESVNPGVTWNMESALTNTAFFNLDGDTNISRVLCWRHGGKRMFSMYSFEETENSMSGEFRLEDYDALGLTTNFPLVISKGINGRFEIRRPTRITNSLLVQNDIISYSDQDGALGWLGNPAVLGRGLYSQRNGNTQVSLFSAGENRSTVFEGAIAGGSIYTKSATPSGSALRIRLATFADEVWANSTAEIVMRTDELHAPGARGTSILFSTTAIGTPNPVERFEIRDSGKIVFKSGPPILKSKFTVTSSTMTGETGTVYWDDNYIYWCIAPNTWKRATLSSW